MDHFIVTILVSHSQGRSPLYFLIRSGSFPCMNSPTVVPCGIWNPNISRDG
uniref:Uncharacterized protein n=1 Tax=Lepeophtheirus salmonis TaxID=72036 RepID=A0A0K2UY23_LEPSM